MNERTKDALGTLGFTLLCIAMLLVAASVNAQDATERVDIYGDDGEYLGCKGGYLSSCTEYNRDSIENEYGKGSEYLPDGIKNEYSKYGSKYSQESWNNEYGTRPPKVIERERGLSWSPKPYGGDTRYRGDLTENDSNWRSLRYWDEELDDDIKDELREDPYHTHTYYCVHDDD